MNPCVLALDFALRCKVKCFLGSGFCIYRHGSIPPLNYLLFFAGSFKPASVPQLVTHKGELECALRELFLNFTPSLSQFQLSSTVMSS